MTDISEINWHDSVILKVIEIPKDEIIIFEVNYTENWEYGIYDTYCLEFINTYNYQIHEGPFSGSITILDFKIEEKQDDYGATTYRIETNAGYRIIKCKDIKKIKQKYIG
jgi:hypothetical protein